MRTATGLRSEACASKPSRWASSGIVPPPANGSRIGGGLPSVDFRISALASAKQALVADVLPDDEALDDARAAARARLAAASSVGNSSGSEDWVVDQLSEQHGPGRGERPARPPQVQCRWVAVPDRLLPRGLPVDRLQRQRHLDQLALCTSSSTLRARDAGEPHRRCGA